MTDLGVFAGLGTVQFKFSLECNTFFGIIWTECADSREENLEIMRMNRGLFCSAAGVDTEYVQSVLYVSSGIPISEVPEAMYVYYVTGYTRPARNTFVQVCGDSMKEWLKKNDYVLASGHKPDVLS